MTEHYKLISDMQELQWYFDHIIAKPNYDEAYAFCMSSRHKKLTKEEREELGQSSDDEMLELNSNEMHEKNLAKVIKYYRDFKKIITQ